ncbi:MAG: methylmalonyl Co-A mutase-associated GTPase MeaB [Alphaproteobacteria bacterium]|nr:methylmalonyl Co-A mutase-associated GTPase MeaB [Alphaproteobacteria bacterium]
MTAPNDMNALAELVQSGDRRGLAQAITVIESTREAHRLQADALLRLLLPHSGKSLRIGISGVPGVGKSTFVEVFGLHIVEQGRRVAVLAVDPSSKISGGSILGDKTRMEALGKHPSAFIRPSPAGGTLGGVARRTREAMIVCEAAGYDVVIVETVGVGQSETAVKDLTDLFLLLLLPGGGDELQGMKKGIVELADIILVNKSDGDMEAAARHAASDYSNALHFLRPASPNWTVPVGTCSALTGAGVAEAWDTVLKYQAAMMDGDVLGRRRSDQARNWLWSEVGDALMIALKSHKDIRDISRKLEDDVARGDITPSMAAQRMLRMFMERSITS